MQQAPGAVEQRIPQADAGGAVGGGDPMIVQGHIGQAGPIPVPVSGSVPAAVMPPQFVAAPPQYGAGGAAVMAAPGQYAGPPVYGQLAPPAGAPANDYELAMRMQQEEAARAQKGMPGAYPAGMPPGAMPVGMPAGQPYYAAPPGAGYYPPQPYPAGGQPYPAGGQPYPVGVYAQPPPPAGYAVPPGAYGVPAGYTVQAVAMPPGAQQFRPANLQPGQAGHITRGFWSDGLCDCCSNFESCILAWLFAPYRWAKTISNIRLLPFGTAFGIYFTAWILFVIFYCLSDVIPYGFLIAILAHIAMAFIGCMYRGRIRQNYAIAADQCEDWCVYCCCSCCATAQEARHVDRDLGLIPPVSM